MDDNYNTINLERLLESANNCFEEIRNIRRTIHSNPELSFKEFNTQKSIIAFLNAKGIECDKIADTGVVACINGIIDSEYSDIVFLRADMDALPITETTQVDFASKNGAMHACGHDMHVASLLGAMCILQQQRNTFKGSIIALFQPGEEKNPGGASIIIKSGIFDTHKPKVIIGTHVDPDLNVGCYGIREGLYMASTDEIRITITGKGGHGALPYTTHDPIVAASALVMSLQTIVSRNINVVHPTVLSLGRLIADGGTNIIPDKAYIEGTLRTMTTESRDIANKRIREIASGIAIAHQVDIDINTSNGFPCVINDIESTKIVRATLSELVGEDHVMPLELRMTGEDFGNYSRLYPSVFFRVGVKNSDNTNNSGLHSSSFCPDERALIYGMAGMAASAIRFRLEKSK